MDCVLLEDSSLVLTVGLEPEINSWACLLVLLRPRHLVKCWLSVQFFFLFSAKRLPKTAQVQQSFEQTFRTWRKIFHGLLGRGSWHYPCPYRWDGLISVAWFFYPWKEFVIPVDVSHSNLWLATCPLQFIFLYSNIMGPFPFLALLDLDIGEHSICHKPKDHYVNLHYNKRLKSHTNVVSVQCSHKLFYC
jgi:hypothetical protein